MSFVGNALSSVGSFVGNTVGALTGGLAKGVTQQNQYQGQLAPQQQSDFTNAISASQGNSLAGYQQFLQNQQQQQQVANQMQNIASGRGPNPAQAMLNNATGQNTANTTAAMASMRGSSANPGLVARNAGLAGAQNQQQAVGQAAQMQANQQLAGTQALSGIYGQQGQQIQGQQGVQNQLFGAATGAQNQQNANQVANYGQMQGINSQVAQNNANALNKTSGSILNAAGSVLGLAKGGSVSEQSAALEGTDPTQSKHIFQSPDFEGSYGTINTQYAPNISNAGVLSQGSSSKPGEVAVKKGPKSFAGQHLSGEAKETAPSLPMNNSMPSSSGNQAVDTMLAAGGGQVPEIDVPDLMVKDDKSNDQMQKMMQMAKMVAMFAAQGGKVPAMVSPGEKYLNPSEAAAVARGKATPNKLGKIIPGKAKVKGDSYANDTVPATLEEGGCVIPRSVMESKNAEKKAMAFVKAHMKSSLKKK